MSKTYRRIASPIEMEEWKPGADMAGVSVSNNDRASGSPRTGDMIARNPENAADRWLIAKAYFEKHYESTDE